VPLKPACERCLGEPSTWDSSSAARGTGLGPIYEGLDPHRFIVFLMVQDLTGDDFALVDWADAPEVHDKIILQSWHNPCYVLPGSNDFIGFRSKNCVYFFN
jgi:hypothetical protein